MRDLYLAGRLLDYAFQTLRHELEWASQAKPLQSDKRLLSTVEWLLKTIDERGIAANAAREKAEQAMDGSPKFREALTDAVAYQAGLLSQFIRIWNIHQVAWMQRHHEAFWYIAQQEGLSLELVEAADTVARRLYEVVQKKQLNSEVSEQLLTVVPFGTDLYAIGLDMPTPYIVSPYWGHRQLWTWLGYAHEVGHYFYRNTIGLVNELKVNLVMELWSRNVSHEIQYIWIGWVSEICADIFGCCRIGASIAHTQLLMLSHMPRPMSGQPSVNKFLVAADRKHPIPFLRIDLAIRTLEKLGVPALQIKPIRDKRDALFQDVDTSKVYAFVRGRSVEISTDYMKVIAEIVLDLMLGTKLDALAATSSPHEPRNLESVLFEPLDDTKIRTIIDEIKSGNVSYSSEGYDVRHLLAAIQMSLEDLSQRYEGKPPESEIEKLLFQQIQADD